MNKTINIESEFCKTNRRIEEALHAESSCWPKPVVKKINGLRLSLDWALDYVKGCDHAYSHGIAGLIRRPLKNLKEETIYAMFVHA